MPTPEDYAREIELRCGQGIDCMTECPGGVCKVAVAQIRAAQNDSLEAAAIALEKNRIISDQATYSAGWIDAGKAHAAYLRKQKHPEPTP